MRKKGSNILKWCIGILIEVVILAVIAVKIYSTKQYKEQLELGDKYLQEMDYGNAEFRMQEKEEQPEPETGSKLESEPEPEYQEPIFVQSSNIQEYKGNIYTSFEVYDNAGMIKIPGNYLVRLIVYDDHIYYIDAAGGTGNFGVELIRMNLDGSDPEVLVNNVDNWDSFCIYDNVLYYTSYESDFPSKSMDLNTMQIENEDYIFRYGSEEAWVVYKAGNYQKEYCCCPGYKEVREVPWEEGWIADEIPMDAYFGMYKEYMYFWGNNMILRDSIYSQENDAEVVLDSDVDWTCSPYVLGSGLYYFVSADEYLHRLDLDTMAEQTYDIANYMNKNEYLLLGVEEVNGKLYIDHYIDEYENGLSNANSEGLELDLKTGTIRSIGKWFES